MLAAKPRLEILLFSVAALELNPQEHVRKVAHQVASHNHTARQLSTLAARFKAHLTGTTFPMSFLEHRGYYIVHPKFI